MKIRTKIILFSWKLLLRKMAVARIAKKVKRDPEANRYPMQWRNDYVAKKAKRFQKLLKVELEVIGWDNIPKAPAVIAPNHASAFDPALVLLALQHPNRSSQNLNHMSVFLSKEELRNNRLVRRYASILDTFFIDRSKPREALKIIEDMTFYAKEHRKFLVIFPEGTRSESGEVGDFKGGAFKAAKQGFLPIVPVTINNSVGISNLNRRKPIKTTVIFHKPIRPIEFMSMDTQAIAQMVQKQVKSKWVAPIEKRGKKERKVTS